MRTGNRGLSLIFCVAVLGLAGGAWAQSKLPRCQGAYAVKTWTNCYGTNMTNSGAIYRGEWLDDKFEGHGTYTYRNNAQYVGGFRANKRHGRGTYTWPDGARFVGEYRDDKRNGAGIMYGPDGKVLQSGTWKDDAFVPPR